MGGHDHGHGPPYTIPSHEVFKVEDAPKLRKVQEDLKKLGLKDPWLRNEVWRYHKSFGTLGQRVYGMLLNGIGYGFAAFVATIAFEKLTGVDYSHHHHHDEHEEHAK
ncbi:NADH dehydrogenase [ubiquinone] 1 beta subcomplex subunit 3 [Prorops nasuta]|uniref:NADH dehydrogenase [ubiquinone] 1 beta subcomplex subunit 3 n=1 Tax=Prorops nasuta TaxID=863751 RepID=UPI0034CD0DBF